MINEYNASTPVRRRGFFCRCSHFSKDTLSVLGAFQTQKAISNIALFSGNIYGHTFEYASVCRCDSLVRILLLLDAMNKSWCIFSSEIMPRNAVTSALSAVFTPRPVLHPSFMNKARASLICINAYVVTHIRTITLIQGCRSYFLLQNGLVWGFTDHWCFET